MVNGFLHMLATTEGVGTPLSTNSTLTELLRVLVPINTGVLWWMVRQLKQSVNGSSIRNELRTVKLELQQMREEIQKENTQ